MLNQSGMQRSGLQDAGHLPGTIMLKGDHEKRQREGTMTAGATSGNRFRGWPEILANAARAAGGLRALGVTCRRWSKPSGRPPSHQRPRACPRDGKRDHHLPRHAAAARGWPLRRTLPCLDNTRGASSAIRVSLKRKKRSERRDRIRRPGRTITSSTLRSFRYPVLRSRLECHAWCGFDSPHKPDTWRRGVARAAPFPRRLRAEQWQRSAGFAPAALPADSPRD